MQSELQPEDIVAWARERRKALVDPLTGDFVPRRFHTREEERTEWHYAVMEIDARIALYQRRLAEVSGTAREKEQKQSLYWERLVREERFKKDLLVRIGELDVLIAKESASVLG